MISGRGLGITGGTIDKLESIEGYSSNIGADQLKSLINESGFFIIGQTERLVPADRLLYKYRDVTGTVASIPLITSALLKQLSTVRNLKKCMNYFCLIFRFNSIEETV